MSFFKSLREVLKYFERLLITVLLKVFQSILAPPVNFYKKQYKHYLKEIIIIKGSKRKVKKTRNIQKSYSKNIQRNPIIY